jgi:hypothetical protein
LLAPADGAAATGGVGDKSGTDAAKSSLEMDRPRPSCSSGSSATPLLSLPPSPSLAGADTGALPSKSRLCPPGLRPPWLRDDGDSGIIVPSSSMSAWIFIDSRRKPSSASLTSPPPSWKLARVFICANLRHSMRTLRWSATTTLRKLLRRRSWSLSCLSRAMVWLFGLSSAVKH